MPVAENLPEGDIGAMSIAWDRDAMIERADRRARELKGVGSATLFKSVGLPEDLLAKRKSSTPTMRTLERAAAALQMTVPQLLGFDSGDDGLDAQRLKIALRIVDNAIGLNRPVEDTAELVVEAYRAVMTLETEHPEVSADDVSLAIGAMLRARLGRKDSSTS